MALRFLCCIKGRVFEGHAGKLVKFLQHGKLYTKCLGADGNFGGFHASIFYGLSRQISGLAQVFETQISTQAKL